MGPITNDEELLAQRIAHALSATEPARTAKCALCIAAIAAALSLVTLAVTAAEHLK